MTDEEFEYQDLLEEARLMTEPYSDSYENQSLNELWDEMDMERRQEERNKHEG